MTCKNVLNSGKKIDEKQREENNKNFRRALVICFQQDKPRVMRWKHGSMAKFPESVLQKLL